MSHSDSIPSMRQALDRSHAFVSRWEMKVNSFGMAAIALVLLYITAIIVTWFRKHTLDGDLIFWMGMSVVLLSGMSFRGGKGEPRP